MRAVDPDRVKRAMRLRGMTQEQLAERVGMTQTAISKLVSGKTRRPRYLMELAKVLGVEPEELLVPPADGMDPGAWRELCDLYTGRYEQAADAIQGLELSRLSLTTAGGLIANLAHKAVAADVLRVLPDAPGRATLDDVYRAIVRLLIAAIYETRQPCDAAEREFNRHCLIDLAGAIEKVNTLIERTE